MPRKKKKFGQHFLRNNIVVDHMINRVVITDKTPVLEIGCGDGFLTKAILTQTPCKQLWSYEIDYEWAAYVQEHVRDKRLSVIEKNILEEDWEKALTADAPWVMLANLPYQVTFPILFFVKAHKHLFSEGVVMVQEEVAQKIVARTGKQFSPTTMLLQYHFSWELLDRVPPSFFVPPPKVTSRLLYFKPLLDQQPIPEEELFWKFVKACFRSPRQTLRNNLRTTHYLDTQIIDNSKLSLRAQEFTFKDFLILWQNFLARSEPAKDL
jgi:16S rRNA (adenine1518-N6/adenine1519-N6)-dimethyltransferase